MFEKNKNENIKFVSLIIGSIIVLILALFLSIIFGKAHVSIPTIFDAIFNYNPKNQDHNIISEIRIPRDLGAVLVGFSGFWCSYPRCYKKWTC